MITASGPDQRSLPLQTLVDRDGHDVLLLGSYPMGEAEYAAVLEGGTPAMVTALLLADRFRLDHNAAALLIGFARLTACRILPVQA